MIIQYIKAVAQLQQLFQKLAEEDKITSDQAILFDQSQKVLVNFNNWVRKQLDGNIKVDLPWEDDRFAQAWKLWKAYKKENGFTYRSIGEQSALIGLSKLSKGDMDTAIAILEQSRERQWSGLFEINSNAITKKLVHQRQTDYKQQLLNRLGV